MHQDFPTKKYLKYQTSLHSGYSLTYFHRPQTVLIFGGKEIHRSRFIKKLRVDFLKVLKHRRRSTRARLTTHDPWPRRTTHDALPTTQLPTRFSHPLHVLYMRLKRLVAKGIFHEPDATLRGVRGAFTFTLLGNIKIKIQ